MYVSYEDLTGRTFGRLTVIRKQPPNPKYHGAMWLCRCECGNEITANAGNLKKGNTTSCGCFRLERLRSKIATHHKSGTRLHRIWKAMRTRCFNPNSHGYKYYGARGISISPEWDNFETFYEWAMSNGYEEHLTIDRINTNGNYAPSNCQWVTMAVQNQNKRVPNGYKII